MFTSILVSATTVVAIGLAAVTGIAPHASAAPPSGSGESCVEGSLDNCYTRAQMKEFLGVIDDLVLAYMDEIGVPDDALPSLVYVPDNATVETECVDSGGNTAETDEAYSYCRGDNSVYIGQAQLWSFYTDFGAAGPTAGLAHEYGHFLQALYDVPAPTSSDESVVLENQADCISGSFISFLDDEGSIEYPKDLKNLAGLSVAIASAEGPDRDHGTVEERRASFVLGFVGDLSACDKFYPDTPLED